ncbi:GNAT family N-acetyltransferase [Lysobacter sp. K5869]|uniref:GNAT family N-acetyltransferase n=1 Tax=Lysobacter sp. K5869 TaxID=2820808 RepID=UPI001C062CD8|nr:GNAT family N-acetyltransferase [Lysobacter sp. K5869]QWP78328.1 GNAT family N-acetyltransferase [Lysobacter sp. K5869]
MRIRACRDGEEAALLAIFRAAVRTTAADDYSAEQIDAWSPARWTQAQRERWIERVCALRPFVAELDGAVAGYADLQDDGLIDHFYVSPDFARRGVGAALMSHLLALARARGLSAVHAHVSRTAQPFFARFGFEIVAQRKPVVRGVEVPNAEMRAVLAAPEAV